jgi:hypothetical protein
MSTLAWVLLVGGLVYILFLGLFYSLAIAAARGDECLARSEASAGPEPARRGRGDARGAKRRHLVALRQPADGNEGRRPVDPQRKPFLSA